MFLPKPQDDPKDFGIRHPKDTRPLGLRDTANKVVAGAWAHSLRPVLMGGACPEQRGFVPRWHFLANVLDIDTAC